MFPGCTLRLKTLAGSTAPIAGLAENGGGGGGGKGRGARHPLVCLPHTGRREPPEGLTLDASLVTRGLKRVNPLAAASPACSQSALNSLTGWAPPSPCPCAHS